MNINELTLDQLKQLLDVNNDNNAISNNKPIEGLTLDNGMTAGLEDVKKRFDELSSMVISENESGFLFDGGTIAPGMPSPEKQFEEATGIPFNSEEFEIVYDGAADLGDGVGTPFNVIRKEKKNTNEETKESFQEMIYGPFENLEYMSPEKVFEEATGIAFDPSAFRIVQNNDAYDDGFDNPISTFSVVQYAPIKKEREETKLDQTEEKKEPENPFDNITMIKDNLDDYNNINREQEIYVELENSARVLKEALDNNDSNEIAVQRSYRQRLLKELSDIKEEEIRRHKQEQIDKLERSLEESAKRIQAAKEIGDDSAIASERSYRQQILNRIAKLKGIELNEPIKTSNNYTPSEPSIKPIESDDTEDNNDEYEDIPEEIEDNNDVIDEDDEDYDDELNDEEIKSRIKELEERRKEIDSQIVKIDINKKFTDKEMELMKEYIEKGKEINKLKEMLPEELESKPYKLKESTNTKEEPEEKTEEVKEDKIEEEETKEKTKRKPRFRQFLKKIIPNWLLRIGFAFRRAIDKIVNPSEEIDYNGAYEEEPTAYKEPEIVEEEKPDLKTYEEDHLDIDDEDDIYDDDIYEEPEEKTEEEDDTIDYTTIDLNAEKPSREEEIQRLKEIVEKYKNDIDVTLNSGRKLS